MNEQEMIKEMPICVNCFHSYVCEEYNLDRDMLRKKCAYYNDHFLDIDQHENKVRKETAKEILTLWARENRALGYNLEYIDEIAYKYGVEVEE